MPNPPPPPTPTGHPPPQPSPSVHNSLRESRSSNPQQQTQQTRRTPRRFRIPVYSHINEPARDVFRSSRSAPKLKRTWRVSGSLRRSGSAAASASSNPDGHSGNQMSLLKKKRDGTDNVPSDLSTSTAIATPNFTTTTTASSSTTSPESIPQPTSDPFQTPEAQKQQPPTEVPPCHSFRRSSHSISPLRPRPFSETPTPTRKTAFTSLLPETPESPTNSSSSVSAQIPAQTFEAPDTPEPTPPAPRGLDELSTTPSNTPGPARYIFAEQIRSGKAALEASVQVASSSYPSTRRFPPLFENTSFFTPEESSPPAGERSITGSFTDLSIDDSGYEADVDATTEEEIIRSFIYGPTYGYNFDNFLFPRPSSGTSPANTTARSSSPVDSVASEYSSRSSASVSRQRPTSEPLLTSEIAVISSWRLLGRSSGAEEASRNRAERREMRNRRRSSSAGENELRRSPWDPV